jgi:hypothetical protein
LFIEPAEAWDLDHADDRLTYLGPAHQRCIRAAASNGGRIDWQKWRRDRW